MTIATVINFLKVVWAKDIKAGIWMQNPSPG